MHRREAFQLRFYQRQLYVGGAEKRYGHGTSKIRRQVSYFFIPSLLSLVSSVVSSPFNFQAWSKRSILAFTTTLCGTSEPNEI